MQKDSKIFDDFAKLASGAVGTLADMKQEGEAMIMDKIEKILTRMKLVKREEFEVVKLMVEQFRIEQEKQNHKIAKLERMLQNNKK